MVYDNIRLCVVHKTNLIVSSRIRIHIHTHSGDACYVASDLPLTDCKDYPKKKPCVNNGCVWNRAVPNDPRCEKPEPSTFMPAETSAASGLQDVSEPAKKNSAPDIKAKVAPVLMLMLWFMN